MSYHFFFNIFKASQLIYLFVCFFVTKNNLSLQIIGSYGLLSERQLFTTIKIILPIQIDNNLIWFSWKNSSLFWVILLIDNWILQAIVREDCSHISILVQLHIKPYHYQCHQKTCPKFIITIAIGHCYNNTSHSEAKKNNHAFFEKRQFSNLLQITNRSLQEKSKNRDFSDFFKRKIGKLEFSLNGKTVLSKISYHQFFFFRWYKIPG